jgi:NAD(P)-dependent dehydrogenase (short-subunit alcohol dehydrogenase family)
MRGTLGCAPVTALPTLAFVGGTGKLGRGLGLRLAGAGHPALIGSRSEERARDTADKLRERLAAREPGRLGGRSSRAGSSSTS